jgi:hypothetical protein
MVCLWRLHRCWHRGALWSRWPWGDIWVIRDTLGVDVPDSDSQLLTQSNPMRFRFTVRDLFLLTLVVALAVGWYVDHRRLARYGVSEDATGAEVIIVDNKTGIAVTVPAIYFKSQIVPRPPIE